MITAKKSDKTLEGFFGFFGFLIGLAYHAGMQTVRLDQILEHCKSCDQCKASLREVVEHARKEGVKI